MLAFCVISASLLTASIHAVSLITDFGYSTVCIVITLGSYFNCKWIKVMSWELGCFVRYDSTILFTKCQVYIMPLLVSLPCLHSPLLPETNPWGQTHATVLVGRVSVTRHCCDPVHGFATLHGFWHLSSMHAILDGQSWSTLHSGSGLTTGAVESNEMGVSKPNSFGYWYKYG